MRTLGISSHQIFAARQLRRRASFAEGCSVLDCFDILAGSFLVVLALNLKELRVPAVLGQELLVGAALGDMGPLQQEDAVAEAGGG